MITKPVVPVIIMIIKMITRPIATKLEEIKPL